MKKIIITVFILLMLSARAFTFGMLGEPTAVILSGGGAKGAYQIGVWKALIDLDIQIEAAYGVSVGAINAAVMASGDYETAKSLWLGISKADVMNISEAGKHVLSGEYSLEELFTAAGEIIKEGGIDVSPLRVLIADVIDEEGIRTRGCDFGLLTFSLTDFKTGYYYISEIPDGELVDYVMASANFPFFQRQIIDETVYIDGGVYKNLPVEMVDPEKISQAVIISLNMYSPLDILDSVTNYGYYGLDIRIISPRGELGSMLDFDAENAERLMVMGYLDGLSTFRAVGGRKYYLDGCADLFKPMFSSLSRAEIENACELLEVSYVPGSPDDLFDEVILPELLAEVRRFYDAETEGGIEESLTALVELLAWRAGVEQWQYYTPAGLADAAVRKYITRGNYRSYYDRYLDFFSYLRLKTEYRTEFQTVPDDIYQDGINSFRKRGE